MRRQPTAADLVERLVQFEGPPHEFLRYLLAVQCRLSAAEGGAILRISPEGDLQIVAVFPPPEREGTPPVWVAQAGEAAGGVLGGGKTAIVPVHTETDMYGDAPNRHLILLPIRYTGRTGIRGVSAFLVRARDSAVLQASQERLELSSSLLSLYEMQLMLQRRTMDMARLRDALEVVSAVNLHDRFGAASMALCNEFSARWPASRVSLGFLRGRGIRLRAISHTENFSRKMRLVQDIESAMEECLDQDVEVIHPAPAEATFVSRAASRLSEQQGPANVCSFPLRHGGEVRAVLTVEMPREQPFDGEMVESMRLAVDLVTARMVNLHEHDRWFGAKAAHSVRKGAAAFVGPKHTWVKLLAIGITALIVFLIVAKGEYTVKSPFVLQAQQRQHVPAPFDGRLETVDVKLGQHVRKGQLLARLETDEREQSLTEAQAEKSVHEKEYDKHMRDGNTVQAQQALARANQSQAKIRLLEDQIRRAELRSPIDGHVIVGDLEHRIRSPVKTGELLFEVAPVRRLRAEMDVDERDVHELREDQQGELSAVGDPGQRIPFVVTSVSPVAETVEGKNVFKVRVTLKDVPGWMHPGMTGVAHVSIDRRRYAWIWTRRVVNWLRIKLWL
jgi:RND family efflux transporter MFP subunit